MASANNELVYYERHGLGEASGCSYLVQLSITPPSMSTTAGNLDWGVQLLNVDGGIDGRCYDFGVDSVITAAGRQSTADFLRCFPVAAAREDAIALIYDDAFDQVGGSYFQGFLMLEIEDMNVTEALIIETSGPVQDYSPTPVRRDAVEALERVTITCRPPGGDELCGLFR